MRKNVIEFYKKKINHNYIINANSMRVFYDNCMMLDIIRYSGHLKVDEFKHLCSYNYEVLYAIDPVSYNQIIDLI